MSIPSQADLADVITAAARLAFRDLFAKHPERFYYCTPITTGGAHAPFVSAWSHEVLAKKVADEGLSPEDAWALKWSYADSPYMAYGNEEYFGPVRKAFDRRLIGRLPSTMPLANPNIICAVRRLMRQ